METTTNIIQRVRELIPKEGEHMSPELWSLMMKAYLKNPYEYVEYIEPLLEDCRGPKTASSISLPERSKELEAAKRVYTPYIIPAVKWTEDILEKRGSRFNLVELDSLEEKRGSIARTLAQIKLKGLSVNTLMTAEEAKKVLNALTQRNTRLMSLSLHPSSSNPFLKALKEHKGDPLEIEYLILHRASGKNMELLRKALQVHKVERIHIPSYAEGQSLSRKLARTRVLLTKDLKGIMLPQGEVSKALIIQLRELGAVSFSQTHNRGSQITPFQPFDLQTLNEWETTCLRLGRIRLEELNIGPKRKPLEEFSIRAITQGYPGFKLMIDDVSALEYLNINAPPSTETASTIQQILNHAPIETLRLVSTRERYTHSSLSHGSNTLRNLSLVGAGYLNMFAEIFEEGLLPNLKTISLGGGNAREDRITFKKGSLPNLRRLDIRRQIPPKSLRNILEAVDTTRLEYLSISPSGYSSEKAFEVLSEFRFDNLQILRVMSTDTNFETNLALMAPSLKNLIHLVTGPKMYFNFKALMQSGLPTGCLIRSGNRDYRMVP